MSAGLVCRHCCCPHVGNGLKQKLAQLKRNSITLSVLFLLTKTEIVVSQRSKLKPFLPRALEWQGQIKLAMKLATLFSIHIIQLELVNSIQAIT